MFLTELLKLFRSCLFTEYGNGGIAGNQLYQYCDEGNDGPDDEQQDCDPSQDAQGVAL